MKPIYFPFTCLSEHAAKALRLFFDQVIVYQPSALPTPPDMAAMVASGNVGIRVPASDSSDRLQLAVDAYHTWARQHAGTGLAYLKTHLGTIPFYDDASVHQIRTDIRRSQKADTQPEDPHAGERDKMMQARVFLQLAQEFDLQNQAIRDSLDSQVGMERAMLQNLQGATEDEHLAIGTAVNEGTDRQDDYMVVERIAAWGSLACHDSEVSGVFVTDRPSALEAVLEEQTTAVEIGKWHLPAGSLQADLEKWRSMFNTHLARLVTKAWPVDMPAEIAPAGKGAGNGKATLVVYLVPDVSPHAFWAKRSLSTASESSDGSSKEHRRNTVIALIC